MKTHFAVHATLWAIWLERNNRIFEEVEATSESIWDRIRMWVAIWVHVCKDFKNIPFSLLIRAWNRFLFVDLLSTFLCIFSH